MRRADAVPAGGVDWSAAVRRLGRGGLSRHAAQIAGGCGAVDPGGDLSGAAAARGTGRSAAGERPDADQAIATQLARFDLASLRQAFAAQGGFLYLPQFLSAQIIAQLIAAVAATERAINRNDLPGHKRGGSVSRHAIDELAPEIAQLR